MTKPIRGLYICGPLIGKMQNQLVMEIIPDYISKEYTMRVMVAVKPNRQG